MKKMTFALACASAVAAFAAAENPVISSINFDAYEAGFKGLSLKGDDGQTVAATASRWLYEGAEDGSTVKAYDPVNTDNPNYLELSTEGGTLWRSINTLTSSTELGAAQPVPADTGLYIDTMVQFTPTEDGGAPDTVEGDKLAIWLNVDSSGEAPVTNLMVKANAYTLGESGPMAAATTFPLVPADGSALSINPGTWYRLTVKAVANALATDENGIIPAFEIRVGGALMKAASGLPFSEFFADFVAEGLQAAYGQNALFPSLQEMGGAGASITLQAVGFKGSGAIDNLQFTTQKPNEDPTPGPVVNVDLTISADHATVTGITAGKVEVGSSLTFTVTAAEGYNLTGVTINGTTVTADADGNYTYTVTADDTAVAVVVTVVAAAPAYPTYIPDNAAIKSKFDAWVTNKANGDRDAASANMDAFLLNVAPGEVTTAKANFKIVSIEQNAQGAWVAKVTGDVGDGGVFGNGYVEIKGSATVDGTYNLATTAETARFFKAFLVLEAPTTK